MTEPAKKAPAKRAPRTRKPKAEPEMTVPATPGDTDWAALMGGAPAAIHAVPESEWRPLTIHEAILKVMEAVGAVRKTSRNDIGEGYNFRGVDQVVNAVFPAFVAVKVRISPRVVEWSSRPVEVGKGHTPMMAATVKMAYALTAPDGSVDVWEAVGEAFDYGDKAMAKAESVAYRTAMLQGLCLPTDSPDPDSFTYRGEDGAQRGAERQQWGSEHAQAAAGEENQAAAADVEEARKELWRVARGLGWEWNKLAGRFKADHGGRETGQATKAEIEMFMATIVAEAEAEEDTAKQVVRDELGGKEIAPDEAQPGDDRGHF